MLVDLRQGCVLDGVDVKTDGTGGAVGYAYAVIVVPLMDQSLQQGVASAIVQAVRKARPSGSVSIGVMAREDRSKAAH